MNKEEENSIKEKVDEMTSINFSITKCPQKVFKKFTTYCKRETNNNYSFGLKLLLEGMEGNVKEALLFEQYIELRSEVEQLKEQITQLTQQPIKESKKQRPKTFGAK